MLLHPVGPANKVTLYLRHPETGIWISKAILPPVAPQFSSENHRTLIGLVHRIVELNTVGHNPDYSKFGFDSKTSFLYQLTSTG